MTEAGHEGSLRRALRRMELLRDHASDGWAVVDPDGRILDARVPRTSRTPSGDFLGRNITDVVRGDEGERVTAAVTRLAPHPGATEEIDVAIRDSAGQPRWLHLTLTNLLHEESVGGILVNLWDNTVTQLAAATLRFQAALLAAVGEAVAAIDAEGRFTFWNPAAELLFGWSADEVAGRVAVDLLTPTGAAEGAEAPPTPSGAVPAEGAGAPVTPPGAGAAEGAGALAAAMAIGPGRWSGELDLAGADGRTVPVAATMTPLSEAGAVVGRIVACRDISAGRRANDALRRLGFIIDSSNEAIISFDEAAVITTWNPAAQRLYGWTEAEALGRPAAILCPPDRRDEMAGLIARVTSGQPLTDLETTRLRRDGTTVPVRLSAATLTDGSGRTSGFVSVATDNSGRIAAALEREAAELRFQAAFEQSPFGMVISALDGRVEAVNPALSRMLGRDVHDLIELERQGHVASSDRSLRRAAAAAFARGRTSYNSEALYDRPDGTAIWLQVNLTQVRDSAGTPRYFMGQAEDITERKRMAGELEHRALHDELTGLPNRTVLNDRLERALAAEPRGGGHTGVAFFDLDDFKHVNDALGHGVGDQLLVQVAERLRHCMRDEDTVGRFGGDEFVVVCEQLDQGSIRLLAERLTRCMEAPFDIGGRKVGLHASLGLTLSREASTPQSLLSEADAAMYRAKELGRNRAVLFDDSLRTRSERRLEAEQALRLAVEAGGIFAHYQPVVDLVTGIPVGVEALARWRTDDGRIVPPVDFVPLAEATGLIVPLGRRVLTEAVAEVARWNTSLSQPLWVAVNLSATQLTASGLVAEVAEALEAAGLAPELLHLEITETVLMDDVGGSIRTLQELKALGVGISIDDFGTGYSSLAYLRQLPVDTLKIDRSFVHDLGNDTTDASIVEAVLGLARAMRLGCVAEGVETAHQQDLLHRLGCPLGQGMYWSAPLSAADARHWAALRQPVAEPFVTSGRRHRPAP